MEIRAAPRRETSGTSGRARDVARPAMAGRTSTWSTSEACLPRRALRPCLAPNRPRTRHEPTTSTGWRLPIRALHHRELFARSITLCLSRGLRGRRRQ